MCLCPYLPCSRFTHFLFHFLLTILTVLLNLVFNNPTSDLSTLLLLQYISSSLTRIHYHYTALTLSWKDSIWSTNRVSVNAKESQIWHQKATLSQGSTRFKVCEEFSSDFDRNSHRVNFSVVSSSWGSTWSFPSSISLKTSSPKVTKPKMGQPRPLW